MEENDDQADIVFNAQMKTMMLAGDSRVEMWSPSLEQLKTYNCRLKIHSDDQATLSTITSEVEKNITSDTTVLVMFTFLNDLTTPPNDEDLMDVVESPNLHGLVEETVKANKHLQEMHSQLKIVWTLPYCIDFLQFNQQFEEVLSAREIRGCEESTVTLKENISELHSIFTNKFEEIIILDLSKTFPGTINKSETACELSEHLADGLLPKPELCSQLQVALLNYLQENKYLTLAGSAHTVTQTETIQDLLDLKKNEKITTDVEVCKKMNEDIMGVDLNFDQTEYDIVMESDEEAEGLTQELNLTSGEKGETNDDELHFEDRNDCSKTTKPEDSKMYSASVDDVHAATASHESNDSTDALAVAIATDADSVPAAGADTDADSVIDVDADSVVDVDAGSVVDIDAVSVVDVDTVVDVDAGSVVDVDTDSVVDVDAVSVVDTDFGSVDDDTDAGSVDDDTDAGSIIGDGLVAAAVNSVTDASATLAAAEAINEPAGEADADNFLTKLSDREQLELSQDYEQIDNKNELEDDEAEVVKMDEEKEDSTRSSDTPIKIGINKILREGCSLYYASVAVNQSCFEQQDQSPIGLQYVSELKVARQDPTESNIFYFVCILCTKQMMTNKMLMAHVNSIPHKLQCVKLHLPELWAKYENIPLKDWTKDTVVEFKEGLGKVSAPLQGYRMPVPTKSNFNDAEVFIKLHMGDLNAFPKMGDAIVAIKTKATGRISDVKKQQNKEKRPAGSKWEKFDLPSKRARRDGRSIARNERDDRKESERVATKLNTYLKLSKCVAEQTEAYQTLRSKQDRYMEDPESHPNYLACWKRFYVRSRKKLAAENIKIDNYNIADEWNVEWTLHLASVLNSDLCRARNDMLKKYDFFNIFEFIEVCKEHNISYTEQKISAKELLDDLKPIDLQNSSEPMKIAQLPRNVNLSSAGLDYLRPSTSFALPNDGPPTYNNGPPSYDLPPIYNDSPPIYNDSPPTYNNGPPTFEYGDHLRREEQPVFETQPRVHNRLGFACNNTDEAAPLFDSNEYTLQPREITQRSAFFRLYHPSKLNKREEWWKKRCNDLKEKSDKKGRASEK